MFIFPKMSNLGYTDLWLERCSHISLTKEKSVHFPKIWDLNVPLQARFGTSQIQNPLAGKQIFNRVHSKGKSNLQKAQQKSVKWL